MNPRPTEKRTDPSKEALLPVTRLVATLSMTIQNGQLVAQPVLTAPGPKPVTAHVVS